MSAGKENSTMRIRFLSLTAVLVTCTGAFAQTPAETAATVNGQGITLTELDAALKVSFPETPLTASQRRHLRATILNDLVDDTLLRQFLAKHGPKVDVTELDDQMKALTARLTKENRTLATYFKETGQTEAQLRADWSLQLQLAGYVKQQATEEQLKAYHAANRDHFDNVEVRVSDILFRVSKAAPPMERATAKQKLQAVRADIASGKTDFAAAARKFSQCPSAKVGGDVGFITRRGLPEDEPLAKAAFALKVSGLSDVIDTEFGFHLLTITERKPGTPSVYEKCTLEVLEAYTDDARTGLVAKLRKEGQIKVTLP